jgi:hypothetical protein
MQELGVSALASQLCLELDKSFILEAPMTYREFLEEQWRAGTL